MTIPVASTPSTEPARTAYLGAIVLPIFNEEENVGALLTELHEQAVKHGALYALFIDDSTHERGKLAIGGFRGCTNTRGNSCQHLTIGYVQRLGNDNKGGLSGAVTDGIRSILQSDTVEVNKVIVMDGDGQHDPIYVPQLLEQLDKHDLAIASRYCDGGNSQGLAGRYRHIVSRSSTALVERLFPRELTGVTDPMTGFFGLRLEIVTLDRLNPIGFKILVEFLLSHPGLKRTEIPFEFRPREHGESKGSAKQGLEFLWQLCRHRLRSRRTA